MRTPTPTPPVYTLVTPEMARQWLGKNHNRKQSALGVNRLVSRIKNGAWENLTHQGIAFAPDGTLIDGQHRLEAIEISGVPCYLWVFRNVPKHVQEVIDEGIPRTVKDKLELRGVIEKNVNNTVAAVGLIAVMLGQDRLDVDCMESLVHTYRYDIETVEKVLHKKGRGVAKAQFVASMAFARIANPLKIDAFASRFASGVGCTEGDPALRLRNGAIGLDGKSIVSNTHANKKYWFLRVCAALHADLNGLKRELTRASGSAFLYFAGLRGCDIEMVRKGIQAEMDRKTHSSKTKEGA